MKATEDLKHEHEAVLVALQILDKVAAAFAAKDDRSPAQFVQLIDFFKGFVDRCHHGKEEDVLFPELERRGVLRDGGPIGVMLSEHEIGRGYVRAIAAGLARAESDATASVTILKNVHAYRQMLEAHIHKENTVLFPMADRLVPEDVAVRLYEQFEEIERDRVGEGKHEAYHEMLHALKSLYGIV